MILEFTGLSGAGKTTREPFIISSLEKRGYQPVLRADLRYHYIKNKIWPHYRSPRKIPVFSERWLNLASLKSSFTAGLGGQILRGAHSRCRLRSFLWLGEDILLSNYFIRDFRAAEGRGKVYIPREGFVHHIACCKLFGGPAYPGPSQKLLRMVSANNMMIIYFQISVEEALDRLQIRGLPVSWPPSINTWAKVKEFLSHFNEAIEEVIEKMQGMGVKVQTLDAALNPQQVQSELKTFLNEMRPSGNNARAVKLKNRAEYGQENSPMRID